MGKMTDSLIEQWVLRALSLNGEIESKDLCVSCSDGIVRLAGTVGDSNNKRAAERAAKCAPGVVAVVNAIRIVPLPVTMKSVPLTTQPSQQARTTPSGATLGEAQNALAQYAWKGLT